ncbi:hypothetical protein [Patulibacter americanus]|uniref:hypothetical protein n=1 Tax=Patulibacter americanus TaxID=588672 RepID=UPI0003B5406C|nr:hypothetical protein [Patulibacter americanus]
MPSPIVLRRLALAGAATGVAALSGCSAINQGDITAVQASPLAALDVQQSFCLPNEGFGPAPVAEGEACGPWNGYRDLSNRYPPNGPASGRLLVAAEVADGAADPVFRLRRSTDAPLVRDDAATANLPAAADGHHWVGFRSAIVTFVPGQRDAGDVVQASVPVRPLASTAEVRSLHIGDQVVLDGYGADYGDRPTDCAEKLPVGEGDANVSSTTCPVSGDPLAGYGDPLTDAQVSAPEGAAATAGTTATLDFSVAHSGIVAEATALRVDASTTVGGGAATPDAAEIPWAFTPEEGEEGEGPGPIQDRRARASATAQDATVGEDGVARTPVAVAVAIPDGTATGDYAVTLRIRDTAGVERTATTSLRVTGKPAAPAAAPAAPTPAAPATPATPAPAAVLSTLKATKVNATRRRVHAGRVACKSDTRCIVSTVVRAGKKRVGFVRFVLQPGKSGSVALRLSRPATALLAKRGGTITVSVDAGGPKTLVRVTKLAVQRG